MQRLTNRSAARRNRVRLDFGFRISDFGFVDSATSSSLHPKSEIPFPKLPRLGCALRLNVVARAGLAPLELVLSLFFLLLMMALVINFGTIASWRVRGNTAARYAAWRTVSLRTGGANPNPINWQAPATMGLAPGLPLDPNTVGQIWSQQDLMQPALRGPAVVDPASGNMIQLGNQQLHYVSGPNLEMVYQTLIGSANLTKQLPLLPKLRKSYIKPLHPVLNHFWRFEDMSPQCNYWTMRNNNDWRLYDWYQHEPRQSPDGNVQNAYMQYQMADVMIQIWHPELLVLDRDPELYAWYGSYQDVYPTVSGCEISPQNVQMNYVSGPYRLISRIEGHDRNGQPSGGGKGGVPEVLATKFLEMYKTQLQMAQQQQPPNQQLINQLQPLVDQLNQFIGTLF
jgi:hypothetical protein